MLVKQIIENEDGTAEFTGVLQGDELALAVETGLNILFAHGAMALTSSETQTKQ